MYIYSYSVFRSICLGLGYCYCLSLYILFLIHFSICIHFTLSRCGLSTWIKVLIDSLTFKPGSTWILVRWPQVPSHATAGGGVCYLHTLSKLTRYEFGKSSLVQGTRGALSWSEGWRPPGAQSTFIRWTGWTLAMTLVTMTAPQTLSWLLLCIIRAYYDCVVCSRCGRFSADSLPNVDRHDSLCACACVAGVGTRGVLSAEAGAWGHVAHNKRVDLGHRTLSKLTR